MRVVMLKMFIGFVFCLIVCSFVWMVLLVIVLVVWVVLSGV